MMIVKKKELLFRSWFAFIRHVHTQNMVHLEVHNVMFSQCAGRLPR